ncbi:futalosine hydrolase [Paenibacillus lentus]|uniref:Futalosine hydrolase n=1 Tax=Paenibacillus lentus TaxID=1338368 RepID=A0A3S8RX25_9BACL|nr:futalosine hydrolase [Paenibacillus lentus]AZK47631.1 futalosine hydrolase [Paenibacillus lentus]
MNYENESLSSTSCSPRILIMTAVEAEREAVLRGLNGADGFEVQLAGVGPIASAINTTAILASSTNTVAYDLVISAGIGGGFHGIADIGSIVIATDIIAADLGAESPDGFLSLDKLGFGSSQLKADAPLSERLKQAVAGTNIPVCTGPILTLSTVTGTAETAESLSHRIPGAAAEAMEGYGVALAAHLHQLPVLEIRAISNPVGPRQRELWKINDALSALEQVCSLLPEVVQ